MEEPSYITVLGWPGENVKHVVRKSGNKTMYIIYIL